ncbi:hypothetical protein ACFLUU_07965 [Chloroflexota bacterium]
MLRKRWNRFFWGMTAVVVVLILVMVLVEPSYTSWSEYYKNIWPGFIATAIGVVFSFLFAGALWMWQKRAENGMKKEEIVRNLEFEIEYNEMELKHGEFALEKGRFETGLIDDYTSFIDKCLQLMPLRTVALKRYLELENELLLNEPRLEKDAMVLVDEIGKHNDGRFLIIRLESPSSSESGLGDESSEKRCNNISHAKTVMAVNHHRVTASLATVKNELADIRKRIQTGKS